MKEKKRSAGPRTLVVAAELRATNDAARGLLLQIAEKVFVTAHGYALALIIAEEPIRELVVEDAARHDDKGLPKLESRVHNALGRLIRVHSLGNRPKRGRKGEEIKSVSE
jgi:hypothetical protein